MAQRMFLQATADVLNELKTDETYILDVFVSICNDFGLEIDAEGGATNQNSAGNSSQTISSLNDLDVFDKNETNDFGEPLRVAMDAIVVFKNTFADRPKILQKVLEYKELKK